MFRRQSQFLAEAVAALYQKAYVGARVVAVLKTPSNKIRMSLNAASMSGRHGHVNVLSWSDFPRPTEANIQENSFNRMVVT